MSFSFDKWARNGNKEQKAIAADEKKKVVTFEMNVPQMMTYYLLSQMKKVDVLCCEWGRGTGKTTMEAILISLLCKDMPRGKFGIYTTSYEKFFGDEIASIKKTLRFLGMHEGKDFYVGRKAPEAKGFEVPYEDPDSWTHCIHFKSGTTFQVLSEAKFDMAVGLNLDGLIVTEAVYCNYQKLERKVFPTIRGTNKKVFEHKKFYCFKGFFSTTNVDNYGKWFTDFELTAEENKDTWLYVKAQSSDNLENLPDNYLEEGKKLSESETIYNAEYLCIRPPLVEDAFYSMLDSKIHCYENPPNKTIYNDCRDDVDCLPTHALTIGVDFGANIISASIAQNFKEEIRYIHDFYSQATEGEMQDDLAHRIGKYYQNHESKYIVLCYDAQGNHKTGNTRNTRAEQFADILRSYGFIVTKMTVVMKNPEHEGKMILWQKLMDDTIDTFPNFRINKTNAKNLFVSMQNTPVRKRGNKIEKDKTSEQRLPKSKQYLATHLGDSADYIVTTLYLKKLWWKPRAAAMQG